jgi:amidohydrolase
MTDRLSARIRSETLAREAELIAARRHIHQHPELSHQERETGRFIAEHLRAAGLSPRTELGGHGVSVDIEGTNSGPTVALRVDIDALPLREKVDVPFASCVPGVMHACGHDAHTAVGLGVARVLDALRPELKGRARVFFQPAEESTPSGALGMIQDGVLEGVSAVWTVHVEPALPLGVVGLRSGPVTAAADSFTITVRGKGGHSARPHLSRDANFVAAQILSGIYHFSATQFDPRDPMVANVGVFRGGSAPNAIAGEAVLEGVIRSLSPSARERVEERFIALVRGIAAAHAVEAEIAFLHGSPSQVNDPALTRLTWDAAVDMLGSARVVEVPLPSLGGEDFSRYGQYCPSVLVRLGCGLPGRDLALHSEHFFLDESVIAVGVETITRTLFLAAERP